MSTIPDTHNGPLYREWKKLRDAEHAVERAEWLLGRGSAAAASAPAAKAKDLSLPEQRVLEKLNCVPVTSLTISLKLGASNGLVREALSGLVGRGLARRIGNRGQFTYSRA